MKKLTLLLFLYSSFCMSQIIKISSYNSDLDMGEKFEINMNKNTATRIQTIRDKKFNSILLFSFVNTDSKTPLAPYVLARSFYLVSTNNLHIIEVIVPNSKNTLYVKDNNGVKYFSDKYIYSVVK